MRVEKQCKNAQALAEYLQDHPAIETVYYPGNGFPDYVENLPGTTRTFMEQPEIPCFHFGLRLDKKLTVELLRFIYPLTDNSVAYLVLLHLLHYVQIKLLKANNCNWYKRVIHTGKNTPTYPPRKFIFSCFIFISYSIVPINFTFQNYSPFIF